MKNKFKITEPLIFFILVLLSAAPVGYYRFFCTLDGAAHMNNAHLINLLLFGKNELIRSFIAFNHDVVPNWTGHLILCFFDLFLPSYLAEKILQLLYLIGLAYSFRRLVLTLNPESRWLSYLIFPFLYSSFFYMGFYNFSIAVIIFFVTVGYWIKHRDHFTLKKKIRFSLFILLLYFSHIFVLQLFLVFIAIWIALDAARESILQKEYRRPAMTAFKKMFELVALSAIPIVLMYLFASRRYATDNQIFQTTRTLKEWLQDIRPIIALLVDTESIYTRKILYALLALFSVAVYIRINALQFSGKKISERLRVILENVNFSRDIWLVFMAITLALYFILPDWQNVAGYMSLRLAFLFFLFLITWIAVQPIAKWMTLVCITGILFWHFSHIIFYFKAAALQNEIAENCEAVAQDIAPNSVVLPVNYSDNWFHGHLSNYLAYEKPMVLLENYECGVDFFPLQWKPEVSPAMGQTELSQLPCLGWNWSPPGHPPKKIDYVFILREDLTPSDSCGAELRRILNTDFEKVSVAGSCSLYRAKL